MNIKYTKEVCKIGQGKKCCRYLICDGDGFQCAKFILEFRGELDVRVTLNKITAQGDNCEGCPPEFRELHQNIFDKCLELQPKWKDNRDTLRDIIVLSVTNKDEYKRIIVAGKTYLVPISDVICLGIKAEEVPSKYKEEK
jgi:hypothetical protein